MTPSRHRTLAVASFVLVIARQLSAASADPLEPQMAIAGVVLEETTLQAAQQALGKAEIKDNGLDAAGSAKAACYVGPDGTTLALISSGEMGGGTVITEFQLVAREPLADYSQEVDDHPPGREAVRPACAKLESLTRATATKGGIHLGMSRRAVLRILGKPAETKPDRHVFRSEANVPSTDKKTGESIPYTRERNLQIEFANGKAVAIRASQITAN